MSSEQEEAERRVGCVLRDKWQLERLLGVGGMASVYVATHRNRSRAAVKVLHRSLSSNADVRRRFLREGYVANTVDHPGAVRVLDDDVAEDGSAFLVLELLEGETLSELWERAGRTLSLREVLRLADELLDVLAAAHEKGIVHRDVKPDNVFVTREGRVKLLDFGIARLADGSGEVSVTSTGVAMGTPAFMAPEHARARWDRVDARTDVWAVGATLYALLSGRYVHEATSVNEMLIAAGTEPAKPVKLAVPSLPQPVADVIDRMLAFERDARFATAAAAQLALRRAAGELSAEEISSSVSHARPSEAATADTVSASDLRPAGGASDPVQLHPNSAPTAAITPDSTVAGGSTLGPRRGRAPALGAVIAVAALTGVGLWLAGKPGPRADAGATGVSSSRTSVSAAPHASAAARPPEAASATPPAAEPSSAPPMESAGTPPAGSGAPKASAAPANASLRKTKTAPRPDADPFEKQY